MPHVDRERQREYQARWRQGRIDKYLAAHGEPPECECGCGERVAFSQTGIPRRFVNRHQAALTASVEAANRARIGDTIPAEQFAEAVKRLREKRGWTWQQMADAGGVSLGHLSGLVFGRTQARVSKRWAADFLRRLAEFEQADLRARARARGVREQSLRR